MKCKNVVSLRFSISKLGVKGASSLTLRMRGPLRV